MSDLEARVKRLEDIEAIRKLKARYFNACDLKDPESVRGCFVEDAKIDYAAIGIFDDADSFVAVFREMGCQPGVIDMHHGANAEIEITGSNEAAARWALYFSTMIAGAKLVRRLGGIYEDEYRRTADGWKISTSRFRSQSILDGDLHDDGAITWYPGGKVSA